MVEKIKEKGFSALEVIIVLVIAVALVFSGFYIWQKNKTDNGPNRTASQNQQQAQSKNDKKRPNDPSEGGKYLVIKEWDVRFLIPENFRGDVDYGIFSFKNGDQTTYFTSKNIAASSTDSICGLKSISDAQGQGLSGGIVALSRTGAKPGSEPAELIFQQGSYWYAIGFSNGGACFEGDTGQETGAFKTAIDQAIRTLEPIE